MMQEGICRNFWKKNIFVLWIWWCSNENCLVGQLEDEADPQNKPAQKMDSGDIVGDF